MRVLVTGASGFVGSMMAQISCERGHEVFATYRKDLPLCGTPVLLDLTSRFHLEELVSKIRPEVIINTAGLANPDACEEQISSAYLLNSQAVANLAAAAERSDAFLVQLSTSHVFDGSTGMYLESDFPCPINIYGESKLMGERAAMTLKERACIVRAGTIFGRPAVNECGLRDMIHERLLRGEVLQMTIDQHYSPTLNSMLCSMILEIAERQISGLIHAAGATRVTPYEFATTLARRLGVDERLIRAVKSKNLRLRAKRPKDSSLDVDNAAHILNHPPLRLNEAMNELQNDLGDNFRDFSGNHSKRFANLRV